MPVVRLSDFAMYPLVELLTGLLFVGCYLDFGVTQATVKWLVFHVLDHRLDDHRFARSAASRSRELAWVCGWVCSSRRGCHRKTARHSSEFLFSSSASRYLLGLLDGLIGAAFGSLLLWGTAAMYKVVRGREGMGLGDVKMMAMVGAFLGLRGTFLTILLGTLLGSVVGGAIILGLYFSGLAAGAWRSAPAGEFGDGERLAVDAGQPIPIAAGNVSGDRGVAGGLCRTAGTYVAIQFFKGMCAISERAEMECENFNVNNFQNGGPPNLKALGLAWRCLCRGRVAGAVPGQKVFQGHARSSQERDERGAAHRKQRGVHDRVDARRDPEIARTGKGTRAAASHREGTR